MPMVMIKCPHTARPISTGIEVETLKSEAAAGCRDDGAMRGLRYVSCVAEGRGLACGLRRTGGDKSTGTSADVKEDDETLAALAALTLPENDEADHTRIIVCRLGSEKSGWRVSASISARR